MFAEYIKLIGSAAVPMMRHALAREENLSPWWLARGANLAAEIEDMRTMKPHTWRSTGGLISHVSQAAGG